MASTAKLRKYKYDGHSSSRPSDAAALATTSRGDKPSSPRPESTMDTVDLKADILSSLRADISTVIRTELKEALAGDFDLIRNELKEVKAEIVNNTTAIRSEVDKMKATITDMETGLSTCADDITTLQTEVAKLKTEVAQVRMKNEDLEGRQRRNNIRIVGVKEGPGSCSTTSVSKLLREALNLDKDILVDRSHRGMGQNKHGKPRVIVARLHYYQDCLNVLRRARERAPLRYQGEQISIFPDYTETVAKARAAFNNVRNILRGRRDVRYGILFPARLRISYKGDDKEFLNPDEAMTYVKHTITTENENTD